IVVFEVDNETIVSLDTDDEEEEDSA
ncbi:unnamed protein product, partial [Didymodactylos carnosus]